MWLKYGLNIKIKTEAIKSQPFACVWEMINIIHDTDIQILAFDLVQLAVCNVVSSEN